MTGELGESQPQPARASASPSKRIRPLHLVAVATLAVVTVVVIVITVSGGPKRPRAVEALSCSQSKVALNHLFAKYPSGLAINKAGAGRLKLDLQALDRACSPAGAQSFRTVSLSPWLNSPEPGK
jgi:hypothetical protein